MLLLLVYLQIERAIQARHLMEQNRLIQTLAAAALNNNQTVIQATQQHFQSGGAGSVATGVAVPHAHPVGSSPDSAQAIGSLGSPEEAQRRYEIIVIIEQKFGAKTSLMQ